MDIRIQVRGTTGILSRQAISRASEVLLKRCGIRSAELSIVLMTGSAIRRINRVHLGHDHVTDVITFDLTEGRRREAEICICVTEAVRNSRIFGEPAGKELLRYVAHGILHLTGHDDATGPRRALMRREEDRLLAYVWP